MTIKTLSAIAIVSAALATPAFAQDEGLDTSYQKPAHVQRHVRGAYNQAPASEGVYVAPRGWATENYAYDHSRPGGLDSDNNPAGN